MQLYAAGSNIKFEVRNKSISSSSSSSSSSSRGGPEGDNKEEDLLLLAGVGNGHGNSLLSNHSTLSSRVHGILLQEPVASVGPIPFVITCKSQNHKSVMLQSCWGAMLGIERQSRKTLFA